jgi:hypothetical protein
MVARLAILASAAFTIAAFATFPRLTIAALLIYAVVVVWSAADDLKKGDY